MAVMSMLISLSGVLATSAEDNENSNTKTDSSYIFTHKEMVAILEKLNSGRDPQGYLTELPMKSTVDVSDDIVLDNSQIETQVETFFAEDMSDDEIEMILQRIANGENVGFGQK